MDVVGSDTTEDEVMGIIINYKYFLFIFFSTVLPMYLISTLYTDLTLCLIKLSLGRHF